MEDRQIKIAALYKFVNFTGYSAFRQPLLQEMRKAKVKGTLLLAREGINGTIAGSHEGIDSVLKFINSNPTLTPITSKISFHDQNPFKRTKVKLKKEIVTMGIDDVKPAEVVGTYIEPENWNELISSEDVTLIDTRNDYEYELGTFENAKNPNTKNFREFPEFLKNNIGDNKEQKIAMFCTGGIRCEKATSYMRANGYKNVFHLHGGILSYLEKVPAENSKWQGECFIFDDRVSLNHDLQKGNYDLCHACRHPTSNSDKQSKLYEQGVSCPKCYEEISAEKRKALRERQRQVQLAEKIGKVHIGEDARLK